MIKELDRIEQLIIWMRRNDFSYTKIAAMLGVSRVTAARLLNAKSIPVPRVQQLQKLGFPRELLPEGHVKKLGRPTKQQEKQQ